VLQDALEEGEPDELIASSVKTQLLFRLMDNLKQEGHRVLIFSMSKRMLDLLELIIEKKGLSQKF
jgi:SNF2 family DNA or RNA helicase